MFCVQPLNLSWFLDGFGVETFCAYVESGGELSDFVCKKKKPKRPLNPQEHFTYFAVRPALNPRPYLRGPGLCSHTWT